MKYSWKAFLIAVSLLIAIFASLVSTTVEAKQVLLKAELGAPILEAGRKQTTFLKIALTGFKLEEKEDRTPANIAIVLDKSGSMRGDKLRNAKEAAKMAVDLLNENDIISIVSYDSTVNVLVHATKVSDKASIHAAINRMGANGNTALFAGVSKAAAEIRKFLSKDRVNRIILLSDGQANVGPSTATELGELGASLSKDGITVTTIGLGTGYNEDLMANLAGFSDGNHAFVENAEDLAKIFEYEFGDVLSVVAQDVEVKIMLNNHIRPIRILGRDGTILGRTVKVNMNQLYSEQEKFILLEVEVPAGKAQQKISLADVSVTYQNMQSNKQDQLANNLQLAYSESKEVVKRAQNKAVVKSSVTSVINENSKKALELRDKGLLKQAQDVLQESVGYARQQGSLLGGKEKAELDQLSNELASDAGNIVEKKDWKKNRKAMKAKQYKLDRQQSY